MKKNHRMKNEYTEEVIPLEDIEYWEFFVVCIEFYRIILFQNNYQKAK